jgi:hypothetical protein
MGASLSRRTRDLCALSDCRSGSLCPYEVVYGCPPYFSAGHVGVLETTVIRKHKALTLVDFVLDGVRHKEWQDRVWPWLCCPFRLMDVEEGF